MFEVFFVLTTIFVAYVVYTVIGEKKASAKSKPETIKTETPSVMEPQILEVSVAKQEPVKVKTVKPKVTVTKAVEPKVAPTKATKAKPVSSKKADAVAAIAIKGSGLKDPVTGEIATAYNNYRFTKRWIKEALVTEGLLEKVYGTNELNPETNAKIKEAITKLEGIDKYKA